MVIHLWVEWVGGAVNGGVYKSIEPLARNWQGLSFLPAEPNTCSGEVCQSDVTEEPTAVDLATVAL